MGDSMLSTTVYQTNYQLLYLKCAIKVPRWEKHWLLSFDHMAIGNSRLWH